MYSVRGLSATGGLVLMCIAISACSLLSDDHLNPVSERYSVGPGFDADLDAQSAAAGPEAKVDAYLSDFYVTQGETLYLYANTDYPSYSFRVYMSYPREDVSIHSDILGVQQIVPEKAYENCCDWIDPVAIPIPADLPSGLYRIQLSVDDSFRYDHSMFLQFVVREDVPGSESQIVMIDNAPQHMAYNRWGGASTYWNENPGEPYATKVSIRRPGNHPIDWPEERFMNWAQYMGIKLEHVSMMEMETNPGVLFAYQTLVMPGHSEYWTRPQREAIDAFVAGGGNLVVLGGNNMWWQVRLEGDHMLAYKQDVYQDPLLGVQDDLVAHRWHEWPVNDPENRTIGLSFKQGGNVNNGKVLPASEGYGGFTVAQSSHRFFAGTGLSDGSEFGRESEIVGNEVDGAEFTWVSGVPIPTGYQQTPPSLKILATSPADANGAWLGTGTVAEFHEGNGAGKVFNGATIKWSYGLWHGGPSVVDPIVSKIMLNVLAEFQPDSAASCAFSAGANDADMDGVDDACDNCVAVPNPGQLDVDGNGTGDMCEDSVPVRLTIDVKPWDDSNIIIPDEEPITNVVVFSHTRGDEGPLEFDATSIDPASLRFGIAGAGATDTTVLLDFNGDGREDMVASFNTDDLLPICGSEELMLIEGQSFSGAPFEGLQKVEYGCEDEGGCHP